MVCCVIYTKCVSYPTVNCSSPRGGYPSLSLNSLLPQKNFKKKKALGSLPFWKLLDLCLLFSCTLCLHCGQSPLVSLGCHTYPFFNVVSGILYSTILCFLIVQFSKGGSTWRGAKQEDCEFETNLSCTMRPCHKGAGRDAWEHVGVFQGFFLTRFPILNHRFPPSFSPRRLNFPLSSASLRHFPEITW